MSLFNLIKGWVGESLGSVSHWAFLDRNIYFPLNNITLMASNGTTQIDHIIVSKFGIFVIEAKNIDGWIFGDAKSPQWSIVRPGRKYRMQNPLHQNYRHVKSIIEFLGVDQTKVHSLVMFWGECEFKTDMPANVMANGYITYIESFTKQLFTDEEVLILFEALRTGALPKSWSTRIAHLDSLNARYSNSNLCAKCGKPLVLRSARSGQNAGSKFYGCTGYPKCRHTVPYR